MGGKKRLYLVAIATMSILSACVQPIEPTPIPAPTVASSPTPPAAPVTGATFPPELISNWLLQNFGLAATNLNLFTQLQVGPDNVVGYTFLDATGQTCAGFVLVTPAPPTIWNGDLRCVPVGNPVIVAPLLFALTNNEIYVAVYGYIDPAVAPNAGGVAATFPDGGSITQLLTESGFVMLRQGLQFPNLLYVIDTSGNSLLDPIPIQ